MKLCTKLLALPLVSLLVACGERVEVPPAHVGKIMTKDGYQEAVIPTSKFRLASCWNYCDRLVVLDVSDKAYEEVMNIFIPSDKLTIDVKVRTALSIDPKKTKELFNSISPEKPKDGEVSSDSLSLIQSNRVYSTYAAQIIQAEVREYLSQYSIAEISSSIEKVNADLRERLTKRLQERTPYTVRYVGLTDIKFPKIITEAQENSAERREKIEQENAQLEVSKVKLERELQEAQLNRKIEAEKAKTEMESQEMLARTVDSRVLELRKLENQRAWIDKWDGGLPSTILGEHVPMVNLK